MIYAGEQGVLLPTVDLYDTGLMQSAIRAAKDKYDEAKALKDELDTYNDFSSPFKKDVQWYNEKVKDPIKTGIDQLYAQGIDPLRTALGRAALANLKRSLPLDKVAELKRNATAGEVYLKNKAALDKAGLYDEEFQKYNGIDFGGFSTYDRYGNLNMWNYESPVALQSIRDILDPIVGKIKPTYDEAKSKNDPQHRKWSTITMDRLMGAIKDAQYDLEKNPSWRYYKNVLMRNTEEDPNRFNNIVQDRLSPYLYEDYDVDPIWRTRMSHSGSGNGNGRIDPPIERENYSERIRRTIQKYANASLLSDRSLILDYMNQSLKHSKRFNEANKDKKIKAKYGPEFWQQQIDKFNKGELDLAKLGLQNEDGTVSQKLRDFYVSRAKKTLGGGKSLWNLSSYTSGSPREHEMYRKIFAGNEEQIDVYGHKMRPIVFGEGVNLAQSRYAGIMGEDRNPKRISVMKQKFNDWLNENKIEGLVDNTTPSIANIPDTKSGRQVTDIRGNVLIEKEKLGRFIKDNNLNTTVESMAKILGLKKRFIKNRKPSKDQTDEKNKTQEEIGEDFYIIPTIRTTEMSWDDINNMWNHENFGGGPTEEWWEDAFQNAFDWNKGV